MKNLKFSALLFAIAVLCCACGPKEDLPDPILSADDGSAVQNDENPPSSQGDSSIQIVVEDDTAPPREGMVRSRLTNEWIDAEAAATRPIAVMIPNESAAIPHYNLSEASILYEANVESRMTRLMALYENWKPLKKIGNIRSARTYFIYWSFEWDAFLVHVGGPYYINDLIAQDTTENMDEQTSAGTFYRTKDRPAPHNVYADGSDLANLADKLGYSTAYRGLTEETHFQFAPKSAPNTLSQYSDAEKALYIDMSGCYPLTRCYFEYNEADGLYYRSQHLSGDDDGPHADASGKQLAFKNVLVQYAKQEVLDAKGYLVLQCHDSTRDGWFFTNGKGIHVNWVKESDYGATKYYDDAGNEIVLNTGKTMICIVNETDSFTFR